MWLAAVAVASCSRVHAHSDTDLAALTGKRSADLSLLDRGHIAGVFAQAPGVANIDLVVLDEAPLELRVAVIADGAGEHADPTVVIADFNATPCRTRSAGRSAPAGCPTAQGVSGSRTR